MNSAFLHTAEEVVTELHERGFFADCSALVSNSQSLSPRDVFIAVKGKRFDARTLADQLLEDGRCGLVLVDYDSSLSYSHACVLAVKNLSSILAEIATLYYKTAESSLSVIAVTGTNGKTTVTRWLAQTLIALGQKAGVIGTLGWGKPDQLAGGGGLTTPDVLSMHHLMYRMAEEGYQWVCLEASSIGLEQGRLSGIPILAAIHTNLTHDHLDYHHDMEQYARAKELLAHWPGLSLAVVNSDDDFSIRFGDIAKAVGASSVTVGFNEGASWQITNGHFQAGKARWLLGNQSLEASIAGEFNLLNASQVFVCLALLEIAEPTLIAEGLKQISSPPGRMQVVSQTPCVIVDFAHTPDALEQVLKAIKEMALAQNAALHVVFGCGGDRDPAKRPEMGGIAADIADSVCLTADNPRTESLEEILEQISAGIAAELRHKVTIEEDRAAAVMRCIREAANNDFVLLAGKGHEKTQIIGSKVFMYSDEEAAKVALARRLEAGESS